MEFERSIFRVHDKMLKQQNCKKCLQRTQFAFAVLTVFSIFNLLMMHGMYVHKRDILKDQIEEQLKPYFYKQYEVLNSVLDHNTDMDTFYKMKKKTMAVENDHKYFNLPKISLNYTEHTKQFIFDSHKIVDVNDTKPSAAANSTNSTSSHMKPPKPPSNVIKKPSKIGKNDTSSIPSSNYTTNLGLKKDDIFYVLIMDLQTTADTLRQQRKQGRFSRIHDYENQKMLNDGAIALYKISGELGTINFANNQHDMHDPDFMANHGISEHLIILSLHEFTKGNFYASYLIRVASLLDPSVIMMNQLMYTFNRQQLYVVENKTRESWFWMAETFSSVEPTLEIDYHGSYSSMIYHETVNRICRLLWLTFTFACISLINALFIRISIKSSVVLIFPMVMIQNRFGDQRMGVAQQRLLYQSMGNIGAMSAYLDRQRLGKGWLILGVSCILIVYYLMYLSCYQFWTLMAFHTAFSGSLNDGYFFYINTIELLSFLFIRTRSSIKYFPKFITLANLMFLMYVNSCMYACQFEAMALLQSFTFLVLCYFLVHYEYEAVNTWNPFGSWTPTENNPRCGYHHMFLGSEYSTGFDIFSMAMPLRFRETFNHGSRSAFDMLTQEFSYGVNYDPRPPAPQHDQAAVPAPVHPDIVAENIAPEAAGAENGDEEQLNSDPNESLFENDPLDPDVRAPDAQEMQNLI